MTLAEFNVIFSTSRWCPPPQQGHFLEHQVLLMPQLHLICLLQKLHPSLIQLHNNFTFQKFSPISIYLTQFTDLLFTLKLRAYYLRDAPVAHFPPTRVNTFRLLPFLTFVRVREVATTRPRSLISLPRLRTLLPRPLYVAFRRLRYQNSQPSSSSDRRPTPLPSKSVLSPSLTFNSRSRK
ncbi:hypothetical protein ACFX2I_038445 [Malus domestica]